MDVTASKCQVSSKGPTYKVDIIVGGVQQEVNWTMESQVTLVRKELLPLIREKLQGTISFS